MKTKILLLILISIVFTGRSASQASTSSEQPEQSQLQSNSSTENRQLSQAQFEEIFDFHSEKQPINIENLEPKEYNYGMQHIFTGHIENGFLTYETTDLINGATEILGTADLTQPPAYIYPPYWTKETVEEEEDFFKDIIKGEAFLYQELEKYEPLLAWNFKNIAVNQPRAISGAYEMLELLDYEEAISGEKKRILVLSERFLPVPFNELFQQEEIRQALFSSDLKLENTKAMLLEDNPLRRQTSILFYDGEKEYIMCLWDMGEEERVDRRIILPESALAPVEYITNYHQYQLFSVKDFAEDYLRENEYLKKQDEILKAYYEENDLQWPPVF